MLVLILDQSNKHTYCRRRLLQFASRRSTPTTKKLGCVLLTNDEKRHDEDHVKKWITKKLQLECTQIFACILDVNERRCGGGDLQTLAFAQASSRRPH